VVILSYTAGGLGGSRLDDSSLEYGVVILSYTAGGLGGSRLVDSSLEYGVVILSYTAGGLGGSRLVDSSLEYGISMVIRAWFIDCGLPFVVAGISGSSVLSGTGILTGRGVVRSTVEDSWLESGLSTDDGPKCFIPTSAKLVDCTLWVVTGKSVFSYVRMWRSVTLS